jgi:antitoxin VapB
MALNIKDPEADQLARRLATLTGESITLAVKTAVRQRIEREERERGKATVEELLAIARRIAEAPNRDDRTDDEILGYDERGLPS